MLDELPPEHRPIAEQVLAGDIPAVRQAIDKENEARKERGEAAIDGTELLALAEKLRPRLRTAEWRDRAEAALADVDEIDLRDLRSVVVAADSAARDDETRALAAQLRESLARRVDSEQATWLEEITTALDSGRAVRALRLSSRPPKAGTILDPALDGTARRRSECVVDVRSAGGSMGRRSRSGGLLRPFASRSHPSRGRKSRARSCRIVRKYGGRVPLVAAAFGIEPTAQPRAPPEAAAAKAPAAPDRSGAPVRVPRRPAPGRSAGGDAPPPKRVPVAERPRRTRPSDAPSADADDVQPRSSPTHRRGPQHDVRVGGVHVGSTWRCEPAADRVPRSYDRARCHRRTKRRSRRRRATRARDRVASDRERIGEQCDFRLPTETRQLGLSRLACLFEHIAHRSS